MYLIIDRSIHDLSFFTLRKLFKVILFSSNCKLHCLEAAFKFVNKICMGLKDLSHVIGKVILILSEFQASEPINKANRTKV